MNDGDRDEFVIGMVVGGCLGAAMALAAAVATGALP